MACSSLERTTICVPLVEAISLLAVVATVASIARSGTGHVALAAMTTTVAMIVTVVMVMIVITVSSMLPTATRNARMTSVTMTASPEAIAVYQPRLPRQSLPSLCA